jgi:Na+/melibiose symporter-like transporter
VLVSCLRPPDHCLIQGDGFLPRTSCTLQLHCIYRRPLTIAASCVVLTLHVAVMSAVQCFDCTFQKNFFVVFLDRLVGDGMSASAQGMIVTMSFALPHIVALGATVLVQHWGLYKAMQCVLYIRFAVAFLALWLLTAKFSWLAACACILANRVVSECVCRLFPLVLSDLTDEDMFLQQRGQSMSASIIGSVNLFSKPGQSLAPILGFYVLSSADGQTPQLFSSASHSSVDSDALRVQINRLIVLVPLLSTVLEWLLWRRYNLHGKYLDEVKSFLEGREAVSLV